MAPYFIRNLIPRREQRQGDRPLIQVLKSLTWIQWALFWSGWLAWFTDSLDFFSVSLSVTNLQRQFNKSNASDITTAITLTLLFRPAGAAIFGIISDRFGRKWPLVFNLILVAIFELGTGFVQTFPQFLAVRSLFGVGMGGVWGLAASTALESLPVEVRGLASGVLQQGYGSGYLVAAVINLFLVPNVSVGWRALFWTSAGMSLFAAGVRALLPESDVFLRAKAAQRVSGATSASKTKIFIHETCVMLKSHWMLSIYAVLLMTGFTFFSHGSLDLYPTFLQQSKGFNPHDANVATIIANCGAVAGSTFAGYISQYIGRRLTIILLVLWTGAFIPLWIIPSSFSALAAGAFCIQFGAQGAWGVIPIQLAEISPPAFRATFPGVAYQLGNMISSAASQIEAKGGENLRTTVTINGVTKEVPDYATVQGILIGVVAAFILIVTILGPEAHSAHFEKHKTAFEEGGGRDDALIEDGSEKDDVGSPRGSPRTAESFDEKEKGSISLREVV
ncbi:MFS general substrate transporter [Peniophora sp. CONT]|nr:MFS general substrate transporter [Peniophora sp. CONT]